MSDKETCQEAIVVIREASESEEEEEEDDKSSDDYRSDLSLDSKSDGNQLLNSTLTSFNSRSAQTSKRAKSWSASKQLSLKEDHFLSSLSGNHAPTTANNTSLSKACTESHNLITERLIKDNHTLRNALVNFGTQRYQRTISELNELNQNLIKSQERIQSANQYLEKTRCNLNNISENLDEIFRQINNCRLKL